MSDCQCKNHQDSSGFTAGLLPGLVTGAASADLQKTMDAARATINNAAERVVEATEPAKPAPKKNFFQKMGASLGK